MSVKIKTRYNPLLCPPLPGTLPLLHNNHQAKKLHDSMEALRSEANKLIAESNDREKKIGAELERYELNWSRPGVGKGKLKF